MSVVNNKPTVSLDARLRVPQGVVYRAFVKETVILNLETGLYHGVNPVGGQILDALTRSGSVREAVEELARAFDRPQAAMQSDVLEFCEALLERGLISAESA